MSSAKGLFQGLSLVYDKIEFPQELIVTTSLFLWQQ